MSNRNYYKGISLDFKAKQKNDCELEAYFRESMNRCCTQFEVNSNSEYTDDEYYDAPTSKNWFECFLNNLCCGYVFGNYK